MLVERVVLFCIIWRLCLYKTKSQKKNYFVKQTNNIFVTYCSAATVTDLPDISYFSLSLILMIWVIYPQQNKVTLIKIIDGDLLYEWVKADISKKYERSANISAD